MGAPETSRSFSSRAALFAHWNALRGDPYELDALDRSIEDRGARLVCDSESLVSYPGAKIYTRHWRDFHYESCTAPPGPDKRVEGGATS